jgi:hypothetical protein
MIKILPQKITIMLKTVILMVTMEIMIEMIHQALIKMITCLKMMKMIMIQEDPLEDAEIGNGDNKNENRFLLGTNLHLRCEV